MCYETKKSAQKTTRHILSSKTEWLKNKASREKWGNSTLETRKSPGGPFGDAGTLGAAQRLGK